MENNMSFPTSPFETKRIDMSPIPGSSSPNRSGGYNSDNNDTTLIMPPPVDNTELDTINLLANPKIGGFDTSPIGSPKNNNNNDDTENVNYNNNNIPEFNSNDDNENYNDNNEDDHENTHDE